MIIISKPNEPETIGTAVWSECIRMLNEDVIDHV
jgi:lipoprotein-anchoring transpeptidase ErfK/SrfK